MQVTWAQATRLAKRGGASRACLLGARGLPSNGMRLIRTYGRRGGDDSGTTDPARGPSRRAVSLGLCLVSSCSMSILGCGSSGQNAADASVQPESSGPMASFDILDGAVDACTGPQPAGSPSGACGQRGVHCIASSGQCCDCMWADTTTCGVPLAWACGDNLQGGCPAMPPVEGSQCDAGHLANNGCTYCVAPGGSYVCPNASWVRVVDTLYCESPLPGAEAGRD
jgi:hypothetical protein